MRQGADDRRVRGLESHLEWVWAHGLAAVMKRRAGVEVRATATVAPAAHDGEFVHHRLERRSGTDRTRITLNIHHGAPRIEACAGAQG
jgi:hypothetical protein